MEKLQCTCCGGTINPITYICDYCGMAYENNHIIPYRVEVTHLPVKELLCTSFISMNDDPKLAAEFAIKSMARHFAESLPTFMKIRTERSITTMGYNMTGTIKIVQPATNYEGELL